MVDSCARQFAPKYMRRATNTVNYSRALPLAQGVRFDISVAVQGPINVTAAR